MTGGTKGIDRAIAECFAQKGASVALCARNPSEAEATAAALRTGVQAPANVIGCRVPPA